MEDKAWKNNDKDKTKKVKKIDQELLVTIVMMNE